MLQCNEHGVWVLACNVRSGKHPMCSVIVGDDVFSVRNKAKLDGWESSTKHPLADKLGRVWVCPECK